MFEIEAPRGTTGAYLAELNTRANFAKEMEFLIKDPKFEIIEMGKIKVPTEVNSSGEMNYVKLRIIP